jgi:5'(3')-deoxyribonucleotidase
MRIYVDFDDVLCETASALADLARARYGREVPFEQIHTFDLRIAFRLDDTQYDELMEQAHSPAFLRELVPTPGAVACLAAWQRHAQEVVVVTGRPAFTHRVSRAWLDRQGLGSLPVWYVDKYQRSYPAAPADPEAPPLLSVPAFQREPFDLMIDDSPMALEILRQRPAGHTVVFDRPWNRTYPCAGARVARCRGWQEVDAFFRVFSGQNGYTAAP